LRRMIYLSEPVLGEKEEGNLIECIRSTFVSSVGPFVGEFEQRVADFCHSPHAVALQSGTAALHLSLAMAGVQAGDEVIVPTLTFVATVNPIRYLGARPVFVDADVETWGLDVRLLDAACSARTKAVLPVHLFGFPAQIETICSWAKERGITVIEDATEGLGTRIGEGNVGTFGTLGCLSFNGNKIITTGGGGMILCQDEVLAERARKLGTQARDMGWEYKHSEVGYNYRMTNLQAAVGLAQMEQIEEILAHRERIVELYRQGLSDLPGICLSPFREGVQWNGWLMSILLPTGQADLRLDIIKFMEERQIQVRPFFFPLHQQAPARDDPYFGGNVAESLHRRGINLPTSFKLNEGDIARIIDSVREFWAANF